MEVLQAELEKKQIEVNSEKAEVEELLRDIRESTDQASKAQAEATTKKKQLDVENA